MNQFDSVNFLLKPSVSSDITNLSADSIVVTSAIEAKLILPDGDTDDNPPISAFHSVLSYTNDAIVSSVAKVKVVFPLMVFPLPSMMKLLVANVPNSSYTETMSPSVGEASRYPVSDDADVSIEYR